MAADRRSAWRDEHYCVCQLFSFEEHLKVREMATTRDKRRLHPFDLVSVSVCRITDRATRVTRPPLGGNGYGIRGAVSGFGSIPVQFEKVASTLSSSSVNE